MKEVINYSGSLSAKPAGEAHPTSIADLANLIRLIPRGTQVHLRATGSSIHDQALSAGTLIYVDKLAHRVTVNPSEVVKRTADGRDVTWATARTTAWTPWEVLVRAALGIQRAPAGWSGVWDLSGAGRHDVNPSRDSCIWLEPRPNTHYLPYVVPSSGRITVGGSLSADTMWRWSTLFGHESRSVVWLDLLAYRGSPPHRTTYRLRLLNPHAALWEHRALHTPAPGEPAVELAPSRADNDLWFNSVIGGFGLLGPILEAKYLLLELDELKHDSFQHSPAPRPAPIPAAADPVIDDDAAADPGVPAHIRGIRVRDLRAGRVPDDIALDPAAAALGYPMAADDELGQVGKDLPVRALTWMWETDNLHTLFDDLVDHHLGHAGLYQTEGIRLPKKTDPRTVTHFALFFPNSPSGYRAVLSHVAFGQAPPNANAFKMWDRTYSKSNTPLVITALPEFAWIGEWIVYLDMFRPCINDTAQGKPRANPIPEFALFMEGHSRALDGYRHDMPGSIQQTWVIPFPADNNPTARARAKDFVARFLKAIRDISREPYDLGIGPSDPVRIQICDVKALPASSAVLSSANGTPVIAITIAIEDGHNYNKLGWGDPVEKLTTLTRRFAQIGARLHLTKNRYARKQDLEHMYRNQINVFRSVKGVLDPDRIYGSLFSDALGI